MKNAFGDWSNARYFLAVCREGSTLAASRKLGAAQPTVARRIEALEHELGLVLFERDTRGFRPTAAALRLLPAAEAMEAAAQVLQSTASELTAARPIRITAPVGNFSQRMRRIVYEFNLKHPGLEFEFLPTIKLLDLTAGEADIALRLTTTTPDPRLICRQISTARYAFFGSPGYAAEHGLPAGIDDLAKHRFVIFERANRPSFVKAWLGEHVPNARIVQSFTEHELMAEAVAEGQGLGVLNVKSCEGDAKYVLCFDPIEDFKQEHVLLVAPEAYRRAEVKAFVKFFAPRYAAIYR